MDGPAPGCSDTDGFRPYVQALGRGETLRRDLELAEARDAMDRLLAGTVAPAQAGAFLIAQRVKGESADEIRGFVEAIRSRWLEPVETSLSEVLDLAVPYDGKARTAQLAPAVGLTLAACDLPSLLHGTNGVPTKEGVTPGDVLGALGVETSLSSASAGALLDATGFAFCDAARFMPAWLDLMPLRRLFGLRTVLNTVEKLVNPADADFQISGFYHTKYIDAMRQMQTGRAASWIVQGEEGSIEMRSGRKTRLYGQKADSALALEPAELGYADRVAVAAGPDVAEHADLNLQALNDLDSIAGGQVVMTAGVILSLFGRAESPLAGVKCAEEALASGRAATTLRTVREVSETL